MNLRRLNDVELISELNQRGYVVRRNAVPREIKVEAGDPPPDGWQGAALELIRERISYEHIDIEKVTTGAGLEINRAVLRIL